MSIEVSLLKKYYRQKELQDVLYISISFLSFFHLVLVDLFMMSFVSWNAK
jgi:hypothetical protein